MDDRNRVVAMDEEEEEEEVGGAAGEARIRVRVWQPRKRQALQTVFKWSRKTKITESGGAKQPG